MKSILSRLSGQFRHLANRDLVSLLSIGSNILEHVGKAAEKPTPINVARAAIQVWNVLESSKLYGDDYFHPDWMFPYDRQFSNFIVDALARFPYKLTKTNQDTVFIRITQVYGEEVGWCVDSTDEDVSCIYVKTDRVEQARAAIKRALWEKVNYPSIVMEQIQSSVDKSNMSGVHFKRDDDMAALHSQKAEEMAVFLKRCIDAGVPRTILLYGRPGTGKSTIAQAVVDKLKLKSLRIRVEDIADFDNSVIFEAINVFEPDAIILDDLDRSVSQTHLLETMSRFHNHVKIVFATVNNRNALDEALMRPGRFDQIEHIRRLDDIVIKKMLGESNAEVFDLVKDWPIAFIQEYVTRRRFMDKEEALSSLKELQARVTRLNNSMEDDEEYGEPEDDFSDEDEDHPKAKRVRGDGDNEGGKQLLSESPNEAIAELAEVGVIGNDEIAGEVSEIPAVVKKYVAPIKLRKTK